MAVYKYFQINNWDSVESIGIADVFEWKLRNSGLDVKEITRAEYIAYTRGYTKGLSERRK